MNQNFEIAVLFGIVRKSNNYVFRGELLPTVLWGRAASYKLSPLFTYINSYSDVHIHFQGDLFWLGKVIWEEGVTWDDLSVENLSWGREFPWRGSKIFWHSWKKKWKNKHEIFFQLDVRSSIKTWTNRNDKAYEDFHPLLNASLFPLKCFCNFNYLFYDLCDSVVILGIKFTL